MKLKSGFLPLLAIIAALMFSTPVHATGFHTCEATERDDWASVDALKQKVADDGFEYRRHKPDGGCYEVYIKYTDDRIAEAYYHPVSLDLEIIQRRGTVLYEKPEEEAEKVEEKADQASATATETKASEAEEEEEDEEPDCA